MTKYSLFTNFFYFSSWQGGLFYLDVVGLKTNTKFTIPFNGVQFCTWSENKLLARYSLTSSSVSRKQSKRKCRFGWNPSFYYLEVMSIRCKSDNKPDRHFLIRLFSFCVECRTSIHPSIHPTIHASKDTSFFWTVKEISLSLTYSLLFLKCFCRCKTLSISFLFQLTSGCLQ